MREFMERDTFVLIGEADIVAEVLNGMVRVPKIRIEELERDLCLVKPITASDSGSIESNTADIIRDIVTLVNAGRDQISIVVPFMALKVFVAACMSADGVLRYEDALADLFKKTVPVWIASQCGKKIRAVIEPVYDVGALGEGVSPKAPLHYEVNLYV